MEEAKVFLYQHNMSISQVAEVLGYCSSQQFSLRFKKAFQVTPREWRRAHIENEPFAIR